MWIFWFNSQQLKAHPLILNYRREYWSQEIYSGHTVVASEDPFLLTATVYRHTYLVLLCFSDVTFFYKLKARPFTSKKIVTCFIVILILLQWSASDPVIPLRYARIAWHWPLGSYNLVVQKIPIFKKKKWLTQEIKYCVMCNMYNCIDCTYYGISKKQVLIQLWMNKLFHWWGKISACLEGK